MEPIFPKIKEVPYLRPCDFSYVKGCGVFTPSSEENFEEIKKYFYSLRKDVVELISELSPKDIDTKKVDNSIESRNMRDRISKVGASVVTVALFYGTTFMYQCSGLIIGCDDQHEATILTSARLVMPNEKDAICPALSLVVRWADESLHLAKKDLVDFYHNLVTLKVNFGRELKAVEFKDEEDITEGMDVIALGRNFFDGNIQQSHGEIHEKYPYFGCQELLVSTCYGNKVFEGGPLITCSGKIAGINFYDDYNFAHPLPTPVIRACIGNWRFERTVMRPWFGLIFIDSNELPISALEKLQIPPNETRVVVTKVCKASPAGIGGVRPGDFVTLCADQTVVSAKQLSELLGQFSSKLENLNCIKMVIERSQDKEIVDIQAELVPVNDERLRFSWPIDSRWSEPRGTNYTGMNYGGPRFSYC